MSLSLRELLTKAAHGFHGSCGSLNALIDEDGFEPAQLDTLLSSLHVTGPKKNDGMDRDEAKFGKERDALSFIWSCYREAQASNDVSISVKEFAAVLDNQTVLSRNAITVIVQSIKGQESKTEGAEGAEGGDNVNKTGLDALANITSNSKYGRISNLSWRLGLVMSSNSCTNMNTPYITLSMDIQDSADASSKRKHVLELSYAEFQEVYAKLTTVEEIMENL